MPRSPLLLGSSTEVERAMRAGGARLALGALLLLTPGLGRRVFGIPDNQDNGALRLLARLFGVRQAALGAWALMAQHQESEQRRLCYQVNAVVDIVDVVALALAGISGEGLAQAAVMGSALGISETLAWLDLLGDLGSADIPGSVSLA